MNVQNLIRPSLREQLTPMIGLNLLLTMENLHSLVWPWEFLHADNIHPTV